MQLAENFTRIGESVLREDYHPIFSFYKEIWQSDYDHIIMCARRCFILNDVFLRTYELDHETPARTERIVSNNALLLCALQITEYYKEHGRFPRILIVDDLVLHGRSIRKLIDRLEKLIISYLYPASASLSIEERYSLRKQLAGSMEISVYAANRQPLLIDDIYLQKFSWATRRRTRDIRVLSQRISNFIQRLKIPNTCFVLSYQLEEKPEPPAGWLTQDWQYRGARQRIYFQRGDTEGGVRFLPTMRLRTDQNAASAESWLTSLVLFGSLKQTDLDALCQDAAELLERSGFKLFPHVLRQEKSWLQALRAQMVSVLLSALYLADFLEASFLCPSKGGSPPAFDMERFDARKIAANFGRKREFEEELAMLLHEKRAYFRSKLRDLLRGGICSAASPFFHEPIHGGCSPAMASNINDFLEDSMYKIGMRAEQSADLLIRTNRPVPSEKDYSHISMEKLLRWEAAPMSWKSSQAPASGSEKLSCMLSMMDNGLMAMNFEIETQDEESPYDGGAVIYSSLKAGELATFSIPRRLRLFVPAFALVERESWRVDMKPIEAVKRFMRYITGPGRQEGGWKGEREGLDFLESKGSDFMDLLDVCGQTMNGWDFNLVTTDDLLEETEKDYFSYVLQEMEGQEAYLGLARSFLRYH